MNIDSAKVLIVAENKLVRWSLKEILAQEGFSADIAPTAGEYLKKIRNHPKQRKEDENSRDEIDEKLED